jgi:hypothetical protein
LSPSSDEAKLKVNGECVYVWAAVDVDTRELLVTKATLVGQLELPRGRPTIPPEERF